MIQEIIVLLPLVSNMFGYSYSICESIDANKPQLDRHVQSL